MRFLELLHVFSRSLLIQASWSFDRMQSLGFAFAIQPFLRRIYPDREEYRSRLRLHMEYFNTQPYLASFILGATARIEQERASGRESADVSGMKSSLMAPLGALGDSFFWGALRPLTGVTGAAFLLAGVSLAPVLFLVSYNLWHLRLRAQVLVWGYRSAGDAVQLVTRYNFTKIAKMFKAVCLTVTGGIVGMASGWKAELRAENISSFAATAGALLITLALVELLKKGASPVKLLLGLAVLCLALSYAGVSLL